MNLRSFVTTAILSACVFGVAQPFSTAFTRNNVFESPDNGQILPAQNAGFAMLNFGFNSRLIYVNRLGSVTQDWPVGNVTNGFLTSIIKMAISVSGEIYVVGYGANENSNSVAIVHKFSRAGTPLWGKAFVMGTGADATVTDVVCDRQGHVLIAGAEGQTGAPIVLRANSDGTAGFNRVYAATGTERHCLGVAENSSIHLAYRTNQGSGYMRLRGSDGLSQTQKTLPTGFEARSIAAKGTRVFLGGGGTMSPAILALNVANANTEWSYDMMPMDGGFFEKIVVDGSGAVVGAGYASVGIEWRTVVAKVGPTGTAAWVRTPIVNENPAMFGGLALDKHNEAYVAVAHFGQARLFKYGPSGSFRFSLTYPPVNIFTEEVWGLAVQPASGLMGLIGRYDNFNSRWLGWYQPASLLNDSFSTPRNVPLTSSVFTNDRHIGDVPAIVGQAPAHGTVSLNGTTGAFTYTPANGYSGPDSFTYSIKKPGLPLVQASASLTVLL